MNVIVTGASRGIGFEVVQQFLNAGDTVFGLTRNLQPLTTIAHPNLKLHATDLSSQASMDEAVAFIKKEAAHIDYIIHNAGSLVNKPFEKISYSELEKVYKVNVFAPYYLTQQLIPLLGKTQKSHVVTISSMGGFQGSAKFAGLSAYSSSKSAVVGLTECLAEEFKEKNVSVNCLAIGAVQTEMLAEAFPGYQAPLSPKQMAEYVFEFTTKGHRYYNGKILPVSSSTP
ncbi:MAG: SDR family oxidoreductase [Bacteroidetes bacterium]|nr:SDR family oxidoreductase [Bacteroidota bacterium]